MIRNPNIPIYVLRIRGILNTTDRGVQVELSDGRTPWLARRHIDVLPGRVIIPAWYLKKITPANIADDGDLQNTIKSPGFTARSGDLQK